MSIRSQAQWRLELALSGQGTLQKHDVYRELISYFRSSETMPESFRQVMADALQRGQDGAEGIRICIEASDDHYRSAGSYATSLRLLEAGREIERRRQDGENFTRIYRDLGARYDVSDESGFGKRARDEFQKFKNWIAVGDDPALSADMPAYFPDGCDRPLDDDEFFRFAARRYADLKAWASSADDT